MSTQSPAPALDIYLYGMIVQSTMHRLHADTLPVDGYGEIERTFVVPGGEAGNAAIVLSHLGYRVKVGGPYLGKVTRDGVLSFLESCAIDCSALHYDDSFDGVRDLILVAGHTRTVFGTFGRYFEEAKRWSAPDEEAIAASRIVGLDPFFKEESDRVAECCAALGKRYVTIDCMPDSTIHRSAAATVIAGEFLRWKFPGRDARELLREYAAATSGLCIFTFGSREILFLRAGGEIRSLKPFQVEVKSTLGAGDTFRAGVIHGVVSGMNDADTVAFAAATAASSCKRFPMALDPPNLEEIQALVKEAKV